MMDSPQPTQREHSGASPGTMLREAREAANLTHIAVGEALHLTAHYIRSLENDEYNKLPGLIFVKGYIKSYGRFLKLDVDALLDLYEQRVQDMPPVVKSQTLAGNYTRKRNDQAIGWAIAATLVILLGLGIGWWFVGREDKPDNSTQLELHKSQPVIQNTASSNNAESGQAATGSETDSTAEPGTASTNDSPTTSATDAANSAVSTVPAGAPVAGPTQGQSTANAPSAVASPPATTTAPASAADKISVTPSQAGGRQINLRLPGPDQLQINFGSNSWLEIDDAAGKRLYSEMLHAGDNFLLTGRAPFQVLLGDARKVKVNFNSSPIDISTSIRNDSTARLTMNNPGNAAPPLAENSAMGARTAGVNP